VGVEILSGTLQKNAPVAIPLQDGFKRIGFIKDIHYQGESVPQAQMGDQVSISLDGPTVGRQIDEKSELWVDIHEKHVKALEDTFYNDLRNDECEALSFFAQRKRTKDPFWGK
jgi:translation initiation factor 5B